VVNALVLRPPLEDQEIRPGEVWSYAVPKAEYLIEDAKFTSPISL